MKHYNMKITHLDINYPAEINQSGGNGAKKHKDNQRPIILNNGLERAPKKIKIIKDKQKECRFLPSTPRELYVPKEKVLLSETETAKATYQRIVSYCFSGGCELRTKFSRLKETILSRSICSKEEGSFEISFVSTFDDTVAVFSEWSVWLLSLSLETFEGLFAADFFNLAVFLRFQFASSTRSSITHKMKK
jgi:hypothetical protein